MMMAGGLVCAYVIPPRITERAKGKADVLLRPITGPVRGIADWATGKWGNKTLPPGESPRSDSVVTAENIELKQQLVFLLRQYEELRLVENERKQLGPLLKYFKPVTVIGADASPNRESLSVMWPVSGVDNAPGTGVMWSAGLAGRFAESGRVRLVTDSGFIVTGVFGRWDNGKWMELVGDLKASVKGIGNGAMRVDHLTVKQVEAVKPGDWVVVADTSFPEVFQNRQIGQVESIRPQASKPLFAEIIIKPRTELKRLREVLMLMR